MKKRLKDIYWIRFDIISINNNNDLNAMKI